LQRFTDQSDVGNIILYEQEMHWCRHPFLIYFVRRLVAAESRSLVKYLKLYKEAGAKTSAAFGPADFQETAELASAEDPTRSGFLEAHRSHLSGWKDSVALLLPSPEQLVLGKQIP
jgi:hypothetical protein